MLWTEAGQTPGCGRAKPSRKLCLRDPHVKLGLGMIILPSFAETTETAGLGKGKLMLVQ